MKKMYAETVLLKYLVSINGKTAKVAKQLKQNPLTIHAWTSRGYIPLKELEAASNFFNVPKLLLNYKDLKFSVSDKNAFKDGIKGVSFLPKLVKNHIISLPLKYK